MNKKILLSALFTLGLLASCGGESAPADSAAGSKPAPTSQKGSSSAHTHTFDETKWENNDTQHWHPATCEHTTQKGSAAAHTLVKDTTKSTAATCDTDGVEVSKCSTCGKEVTKTINATGHVWTAGTKAGGMTPETCANNHHAYRFDVADAEGWNNATTKMNGKPDASGPTANSESKWTIDATALPAGTYDIYIIGHMSYDSHSNRTWANQWETDTAETPDKQTESPFRYWVEVGSTKYDPNVTATWGELGYTAGDDMPGLNATGVTIAAGQTEVKLEHGNIGYSMIISSVRFVAK